MEVDRPIDYIERIPGGAIITTTVDKVFEWGARIVALVYALRSCVLRDRDDGSWRRKI